MAGMQNIREGLTGNLTKIIVIAIIITFVGSIGWAGFFSQGNENIIAKIGSKEITASDLNFEIASQQFAFNQRFPDEQIDEELLIELSIESLIRKFGVLEFFEKNDLYLSDSYIFGELSKDQQFQENGRFSKQVFDAYARSNGFIPQEYLNRIKQDLVLEFWRQSLTRSSFLSETEVKKAFTLSEQERDISFVRIPIDSFSQEVDISEDSLMNFYDENLNDYSTEKKARVNYISLSLQDLKSSVDVSDSDIEAEYKNYSSEFDTTERKSVSHIMVNIDSKRSKQDAFTILENAKDRLSKGEDFNSLVIEISDDEGSKESGGSLGVTDGTLLPIEFEEALSGMDEGEIFGPIYLSSNNSAHLIKLTKKEIPAAKSLASMRSQIEQQLITESAQQEYGYLLDNASDLVFSMGSLESISEELKLEIVDSGLFPLSQITKDLDEPSIVEIISDESLDNVIELLETSSETAIIFERIEFQDKKIIDFNDAKEEVLKDYKLMAKQNLAREFVDSSLLDLNEGKSFNSLTSNVDFEIETYKGLKRDSSLLTTESISNIFNLPRSGAGYVYGSSVAKNGDYLIYRLDSVQSSDSQMDPETQKAFADFLNEQRFIAEYSELSLTIQENSKVVRTN